MAFDVPFSGPMLVLDLLHWIQENRDAKLAFRYSCRTARCGTCTVVVNGQPVLACQERVENTKRSLRIEPLAGFPRIRDLVVDTSVFRDRWESVLPFISADHSDQQKKALKPVNRRDDVEIDHARGCIKCGACYSACGMSGEQRPFIGPAALNLAMILVADSRDGKGKERLGTMSGSVGVDACHYQGSCTRVCPRGLDPAAAINRLRRWRLKGAP